MPPPDDKKGECKTKKIYPDEDGVMDAEDDTDVEFPLIMNEIHKRVRRDFKSISDFKKYGVKGKPIIAA